ncbi:TonB-dependent receptor [Pseudaquabacterium terrae]|uniref:TonB-dependent receptor n=1 Tax=Pseudaquabacterium terrae TaxID=2732868 RepID=UPI001FEA7C18|nr:TonB-dependent receptor [Aquabacterium terrae]
MLSTLFGTAHAQTIVAHLPQSVEVTGRHYDNAIGSSDAASQGVIRAELLKSRPAQRPGEVLEFVPGLIVTQHSGDGKANQYFLRGFNLDHGTDFATSVNGMPVNLPSHGHGQGYTDLNFLMPELVQRIEYRKGPYFAKSGDFASAGAADIAYRQRFDAPFAQLTLGEHAHRRAVAGGSTMIGNGLALLGAVELMGNDGPWTVPEGLRKRNAVLTLSGGDAANGWSASAMGYSAHWTGTDQVPQRLIDAGRIDGRGFGRFDSLDDSTGGRTSRSSLSGEWHRNGDGRLTRVAAYLMRYRLALYSNFSYALERPDTGDQFSQQDRRTVAGFSASHAFAHQLGPLPARSEIGLQLRHDRARVGLFDTARREVFGVTREDDLRETLAGAYGQSALEFTPWLRGVFGLRADALRTRVDSLILADNSGAARDRQLSPKLALIAGPFAKTEVFFNAGRGFHSNDARGTTARFDPKSGAPVERVPGLAASRGVELGLRSEALPGLQSSLALWKLDVDSELVYVGDAGATEASGASRRRGVEWNNRWAIGRHGLIDADFAWTHARFANGDRIPHAVDRVASIAMTVRELGSWSASLQWRYLGPGALVEDNSVRSLSSLTTNLRIAYQLPASLGKDSALTLDVFNLADRRVDDIQYFYESRLPGEAEAVADRHVHPAEPRTLRVTLRLGF